MTQLSPSNVQRDGSAEPEPRVHHAGSPDCQPSSEHVGVQLSPVVHAVESEIRHVIRAIVARMRSLRRTSVGDSTP